MEMSARAIESLIAAIAAATSPTRPRSKDALSINTVDSDARQIILAHETVLSELEHQVLAVGGEVFEEIDHAASFLQTKMRGSSQDMLHRSWQRELESRVSAQARQSEAEVAEAAILREEREMAVHQLEEMKCAKGKVQVQRQNLERSLERERGRAAEAEEMLETTAHRLREAERALDRTQNRERALEKRLSDALQGQAEAEEALVAERAEKARELERVKREGAAAAAAERERAVAEREREQAESTEREQGLQRRLRESEEKLAAAERERDEAEAEAARAHQQAAARNTQCHLLIAGKEQALVDAETEAARLERQLEEAVDVQIRLQNELRETSGKLRSDAYKEQRLALANAEALLRESTAEVERLREEVMGLRGQLVEEVARREQALTASNSDRLLALEESERQRRSEAHRAAADAAARDRLIDQLKHQLGVAEAAAAAAEQKEAATRQSLGEEVTLLRERLTALGDVDLLFQVSEAQSIKALSFDLEKLKRENLDLKIRVRELEGDNSHLRSSVATLEAETLSQHIEALSPDSPRSAATPPSHTEPSRRPSAERS